MMLIKIRLIERRSIIVCPGSPQGSWDMIAPLIGFVNAGNGKRREKENLIQVVRGKMAIFVPFSPKEAGVDGSGAQGECTRFLALVGWVLCNGSDESRTD